MKKMFIRNISSLREFRISQIIFFQKQQVLFHLKTIKIFAKNNKNEDYNKYHKIRINMQKVNFPKELQSKYDLFKIPKKSDSDVIYEEIP